MCWKISCYLRIYLAVSGANLNLSVRVFGNRALATVCKTTRTVGGGVTWAARFSRRQTIWQACATQAFFICLLPAIFKMASD